MRLYFFKSKLLNLLDSNFFCYNWVKDLGVMVNCYSCCHKVSSGWILETIVNIFDFYQNYDAFAPDHFSDGYSGIRE